MNAKYWAGLFAVASAFRVWASEVTVIGEWPEVRRGTVTRVTVADNKAYLASTELLIVDVSDPASPTLLGHVDIGASVAVDYVTVRGNYAYVSAANGFHVVDVSAPANPRITRSHFFESSGGRIVLDGDRAYVPRGTAGVHIYDVSNPADPTFLGGTPPPWSGGKLAVQGNFLYKGAGPRIDVFDVTDPASPVWRGMLYTSNINELAISGNYLYAAADTAGIQIFDISEPTTLIEVARFENERNAEDISIAGNLAALADRGAGVVMVDISNPRAPTRLGSYEPTGNLTSTAKDVVLLDNRVFAANGGVLEILDVSTPSAPRKVGLFGRDIAVTSGLAIRNNIAFLAESDGLHAIDISNPANPAQVGIYRPGTSLGRVELKGHIAFVRDFAGGLDIVDVSNPANMARLGVWGGDANWVANIEGNLGFFSNIDGLRMVDLTTPQNPVLLGTYENHAPEVAVAGHLAYLAAGADGLEIVDIQNPAAPVRIATVPATRPSGVAINGNHAYVMNAFDFQIFDVSSPTTATLLSTIPSQLGIQSMDLCGDRLLLRWGRPSHDQLVVHEVIAFDVSDPARPRNVGSIHLLSYGSASDMELIGGKIFAAHAGLKILQPGPLATPVLNARLTPAPAFSLSGLPGSRYVVEHTTSLDGAEWTALPELNLITSPQALAVPENARFVRARLAP